MGIDPERITLKDFSRVVTPRLLQRDVDDEVRDMFRLSIGALRIHYGC